MTFYWILCHLEKLGSRKRERIDIGSSMHVYLRAHCVPGTVLCSFWVLSTLVLATAQQSGGGCPHFADKKSETREVRDLFKVTQLISGGTNP